MIDVIEGTVTKTVEEGEPWEYSTTITEKVVTGWLQDRVRIKTGNPKGVVTSWEDSSSYGTCEVCGSYSEAIKIYVDGVEVYSGDDSSGMDTEEYPNPFIKLNEWLNQ